MQKRPVIREKVGKIIENDRIQPGTFLHKLVKPGPTQFYEPLKTPIYQKEAYLKLMERNCKDRGIEFIPPDIPDSVVEVYETKESFNPVDDWDKIYVKLKYKKNKTVGVKLVTSFQDIYNKYCVNSKTPPIKTVVSAYKAMGYPEEFTDNLFKNHTKKMTLAPKIFKRVDLVLNKEPVKKPKKKKEEPPPQEEEIVEENEADDDNENNDDPVDDDGGMDIEVDQDDEDVVEEEYYSDMD